MPETLPTDPVELEKAVRSLVAAELTTAATTFPEGVRPRIYGRPRFVVSEPEWLKIMAIRHPQSMQQGGMETRAVLLSLDDFSEVDEGACFHTQLTLTYGVDVMFGIVDRRKDSTNSYDDFVAYLMHARLQFKGNRSFGYPRNQLEHKLLQTATAAREEKLDYAEVHRINLSLAVVVG
jgi:hypothetical protein